MVDVARHTLQSTEEHGLAHHSQVGTQRVHHLHGVLVGISVELEVGIIACLGERVVQYLHEALAYQLFCHDVLGVVVLVFLALYGERALQLGRNLHVVVSVDTQDVLHHVARTLHVNTEGWNEEVEALGIFLHNLHLQ